MRFLALLTILLGPMVAFAQDWENSKLFGRQGSAPTLRVLSSTDISFFEPIIEDFIASDPTRSVEYLVTGTADLDRRFRAAPEQFDIVISSAMDLQLKLANDGFAAQLGALDHPDWAQWHNSVFAFTTEPAAIVINTADFGALTPPASRQDMIELLRAHPDRFRGRIGTYDVRQSGLGYLFATQDARASETYWRLTEVMGGLDAKLYCCSGDMINDLLNGDLLIAYNVLGSYALAQASDELSVILPSEFPTTMMRTILVSKNASNPNIATAFVRHLLALQADGDAQKFPLPPLSEQQGNGRQTAISLDAALMTYLDQMKRDTFIREWENAIVQRD